MTSCFNGVAIRPATDDRIELQVGEKIFFTTKFTLTKESAYFQSMFSGPWNAQRAANDRTYFVDGDGEAFKDVLTYLRKGIFPVFFDRVKGHDYARYHSLLEDAKYYAIPALEQWLEEERYAAAVTLRRTVWVREGEMDFTDTCGSSAHYEHIVLPPNIRKTYVCPRKIPVHYGRPGDCGRACLQARGDDPVEYDEEQVERMLTVGTSFEYDRKKCIDG